MLGRDLMTELDQRGHDAVGLGHHQMDVTDAEAVKRVLGELRPDAVIHCAAHTAVDAAESDKAACTAVNTAGTANVAAMCADPAQNSYMFPPIMFSTAPAPKPGDLLTLPRP